jgi:Tfp pilus assembly protein PilF
LALDCTNRWPEAIQKLEQASAMEPTAHVFSQIGMVYAKHQKYSEALGALLKAEKADPRFEMTYVYRGNIYEVGGDRGAASREYRHALEINPGNQAAREALGRVSR